ncbi:ankyrin repeat domain-containing protein 26-like [Eulemur rufifrons]|uniref:ankyrin repeat domain-containing protein 26-like n=1 Tax=Eulemur rufifrons TaxID=859984 RepID=UPI00374392A6
MGEGRLGVEPARPGKQDFGTPSEQDEEESTGSEINETRDTEHPLLVKIARPKTAVCDKRLWTSRSAQQDVVATSEQEEEKLEGSENNQPQVEKARKKHKSIEREVFENFCDDVTDDSDGDGLVQQRTVGKTDHRQFARKENEERDRPTKRTFKKQNKMRNQTHSMDDRDDLTCSSEAASEDFELPSFIYKNFTLFPKQLGRHRTGSFKLLKKHITVLLHERMAELKKLTEKAKKMETKVSILQKELSEKKGIISELERQKFEWERERCSLRQL